MSNELLNENIPATPEDLVKEPAASQQEVTTPAERPVQAPQNLEPVLSVGKILWFFILMAIPVVNLIIVFRWSFSKKTNKNLMNLSRAMLIVFAITFVLYSYLLFVK